MLRIHGNGTEFMMEPGAWRSKPEHDVAIGRHVPSASSRVDDFMRYFAERYAFKNLKTAGRMMAMAAAHHRFNYIHPFPDGNGRVSRLMSHAMAQEAGIGAHGLWSISRGVARGKAPSEYKQMMDLADTPRQGDLDGRGNLSLKALAEFVLWFLRVSLDQVKFMESLFELDSLGRRLRTFVDRSKTLKPESTRLLEEALMRGQFERGESARITGLPDAFWPMFWTRDCWARRPRRGQCLCDFQPTLSTRSFRVSFRKRDSTIPPYGPRGLIGTFRRRRFIFTRESSVNSRSPDHR
jgi:Fic family protein